MPRVCSGLRLRREPAPSNGHRPPLGRRRLDIGWMGCTTASPRRPGYGPSFQGMRAAWRRGDDVFAEVALAEGAAVDAGRFGVHPALLDAALHTMRTRRIADAGEPALPFSSTGIVLHATGAAKLRVHMVRTDTAAVSLRLADTTGAPVATVGTLAVRPISAAGCAPPFRG